MTTKNALRVRRFRMRKREYSDTLRTWTPKLSVTEEVRDGKTGLYISWEFSPQEYRALEDYAASQGLDAAMVLDDVAAEALAGHRAELKRKQEQQLKTEE